MEDSGVASIDIADVDDSFINGAQVSTAFNLDYLVDISAYSMQIGAADITDADADDDASQHIDTKCVAVATCVANSGDHRKVVSHIFGRNKGCTRDLPNHLWIFWCRKHYQRFKYRAEDAENWHTIQLGLVRNQLQMFEDWGEVRTWTIALRKSEQDALAKENKNGVTTPTNYASSCWERFLVPHLGHNKTFAQIRQVLQVIEHKFNEAEYRNREKKSKMFPGVEFLPIVHKAKVIKKPALKKGEVAYKKITLDQPAFNRKTRANSLIKSMAAKQAEGFNSRKSSGTPIKKSKSPDTAKAFNMDPDSKALNKKRKSTTPSTATSPTPGSATPSSKRRRLTRGYEKHGSDGEDKYGSDGEDSTFIEKEQDGDEQ